MATGTLTGTTIASTYKSILKLGTNTAGDGAAVNTEIHATTLKVIEDGHGSNTSIQLAQNRVEIVPVANHANAFEVSQADGTQILNINSTTPAASLTGTLTVSGITKVGTAAGSGVDAYLYTAGTAAHVGLQWDADGNTEGTLIGGADDHGVDFKFFGETSGAYVQWDQSADNLILAGGAGIVEAGGALKENLLTNSGFDVWSNSTLENVGSDLVVNGAFGSDTDGWVGSSGNVAHDTNKMKVTATAAYGYGRTTAAITVVPGKLYRLKYKYQNTASEIASVSVYNIQSTGNYANSQYSSLADLPDSTSMSAEQTWIFEAEAGNTTIYLGFHAKNDTDICWFDDISLYEVTPGCVAADQLACDGWVKDTTLDIHREHNHATYSKDGSFYSLKCTPSNGYDYIYWPKAPEPNDSHWVQRFAGRTITIGAWVWTATGDHVRTWAVDGTDYYSSYHTGVSGWEWLELTHTMSASATYAYFGLRFTQSSGVAYISQPILVFGSSIGEGNYTRPVGEVVKCEKSIYIFNNDTISSNADYNLEVQSSGKIPKGTKALFMRGNQVPAAQGNYFGIACEGFWQFLTYHPTGNTTDWHARINVEQSGNAPQINIQRSATIGTVYMSVTAVELF
jgi:hypothetical protein